jgi:hypothetical protein
MDGATSSPRVPRYKYQATAPLLLPPSHCHFLLRISLLRSTAAAARSPPLQALSPGAPPAELPRPCHQRRCAARTCPSSAIGAELAFPMAAHHRATPPRLRLIEHLARHGTTCLHHDRTVDCSDHRCPTLSRIRLLASPSYLQAATSPAPTVHPGQCIQGTDGVCAVLVSASMMALQCPCFTIALTSSTLTVMNLEDHD